MQRLARLAFTCQSCMVPKSRPMWGPCSPGWAPAFPTQLVSGKDQCSYKVDLRDAFLLTDRASKAVGNPPASEHRGGHPARTHHRGRLSAQPWAQDAAVLRSSCHGLTYSSVRPTICMSVDLPQDLPWVWPCSPLCLWMGWEELADDLVTQIPNMGSSSPAEMKGCRGQWAGVDRGDGCPRATLEYPEMRYVFFPPTLPPSPAQPGESEILGWHSVGNRTKFKVGCLATHPASVDKPSHLAGFEHHSRKDQSSGSHLEDILTVCGHWFV